ncbi:MAG: hypothetical protein KME30_26065 [Iphinoe sp. HA4291-MV1]|jgi:hypothetical protein|nr:hypothetical protein [Iphinoe sp. HA4291-MV1]
MHTYTRIIFSITVASCTIVLNSCSQPAPSTLELKQQLQNRVPEYWEITSLEIKERENLGTASESKVSQRFQAQAQLKEDLFTRVGKIVDIPFEKQANIVFLALSKKKGQKINIQGLSIARLVEKKWYADFSFSKNPMADFGKPINSFSGNLMIRDSKEEKDFIAGIQQEVRQKEEKRNRIKSAIKSGSWLSGKWKEETVTVEFEGIERKDNTFGTRNFQIRFKSFDENTGWLSAEIKFPSSLRKFEGELKGEQISLEEKSIISGHDDFGLGMNFNFSFEEPSTMSGRWEYIGSVTLPDGAIAGTVKIKGSTSFKLK